MIIVATAVAALSLGLQTPGRADLQEPTAGCLEYVRPDKSVGICPLANTRVAADLAGFGARVTVVQTFVNPSSTPIEAVYTFPLPADAAVDRMRMKVGDRVIEGEIKRREDARRIYEEAKNAGKAASLLDQERPNIFTQSVANIMPKAKIEIEISYVQMLKFEEGSFEFSYPMVVGHRYTGQGTNDPEKIVPPIVPKGKRTGAGIELQVNIAAGMTIESIDSVLHDVEVHRSGVDNATVRLARRNEIPNRDFVLRYRVAGKQMKSAFLSYADPQNGGFFTLILMPPKAPAPDQVAPKEVLFVMDQSGSQSGFPIQKSKELTRKLIDTLGPNDTFNVLSFNTQVTYLWPAARPASEANRHAAYAFVSGLQANGGTHLIDAVRGALAPKPDPDRRRIVVFNTDGYIGNDFEVLDAVAKNRASTRMFTFGIGNSVNRFLIDMMAQEGRGDAEYVTLAEDAEAATARFIRRTRNPVLIDVEARFEGVEVEDVLPRHIPDVFGDHPVVLKGRYTTPGRGRLVVTGLLGGDQPWSKTFDLNLPSVPEDAFSLDEPVEANESHDPADLPDVALGQAPHRGSAIATLWARSMIDEVGRMDYLALQRGDVKSRAAQRITRLGLAFGLMTQYTSFVAVESRVVNMDGKPRTVRVPVEMADGVSYEGIFGTGAERTEFARRLSTGAASKGGYGGGGVAASMPPATAGVALKMADADKYTALREAKELATMSDEEVAATAKVLNPKSEAEWLKGATPEQRARYRYLARIDAKLRKSASERLEIQIEVIRVGDDLKAKLEAAGVKVSLVDTSLKVAFGSIRKADLERLAQLEAVVRVRPM